MDKNIYSLNDDNVINTQISTNYKDEIESLTEIEGNNLLNIISIDNKDDGIDNVIDINHNELDINHTELNIDHNELNIDHLEKDSYKQYYINKKIILYKTEMCRSFSEQGICKYGESCQFSHSFNELRYIKRHPKYKTVVCKTFWNDGSCPYGKRCCFIHLEKKVKGKKEKIEFKKILEMNKSKDINLGSEEIQKILSKTKIDNLKRTLLFDIIKKNGNEPYFKELYKYNSSLESISNKNSNKNNSKLVDEYYKDENEFISIWKKNVNIWESNNCLFQLYK